ncbi:MAG: acylphosphatase [Candidatus Colwellbacteria bacterium]
MKHIILHVQGRVQGVFFRDAVLKKAYELTLGGFVRNEVDGSVYIEAEGEDESVDALLHWCREGGPPMAEVSSVASEEDSELRGFKEFTIDKA